MQRLLTTISLLFCFQIYAQVCENTDFEYGNFTNWTGYTGYCCGAGINTPGIVAGRHTIITTSTLDPNTNNTISTMPPTGSGAYSVKLGNSGTGSQAERLVRSFMVSPANQLLVYQYALVLQDPGGHSPNDKPKFEVRIFDEFGNIINPQACGYYQVTAGPQTSTWGQFGQTRYKDWSTVGVDLSAYIGTIVTIEYSVEDCGLGGHYGYAYLDASCGFLGLNVVDFCVGSVTTTLEAPDGFSGYYWPSTGEITQTITIPTPNPGDSVIVQVTNEAGCTSSILHVFVDYPLPLAVSVADTVICIGEDFELWADGGGPFGNYSWMVNGVEVSDQQYYTVSPTTTTEYEVLVTNQNGCVGPESLDTVLIVVNDSLLFDLGADVLLCQSDTLTLLGPTGALNYLWSTAQIDTLGTNEDLSVVVNGSGMYYLTINDGACSYMDSVSVGIQDSSTLAEMEFIDFCAGDSTLALSGPAGYINYDWSTGNSGLNTTVNPYLEDTIQLFVTSPNGCLDSMLFIAQEVVTEIPNIVTPSDTVCMGQSVVLMVDQPQPGTVYNWYSIPTGLIGTGVSVGVNVNGTSYYVVEALNTSGCLTPLSYDTITMYTDTSVVFELGPNISICEGQLDTLYGPPGMVQYEWYFGGTTVIGDSAFVINGSYNGLYYLTVNSANCQFTDFVQVSVTNVDTFNETVDFCSSQTSLQLNAPAGYSSTYWPDFGNTNSSNTAQNPLDGQIFQVFATDQCVDTFNLVLSALQASSLTPLSDTIICIGSSAPLSTNSTFATDVLTWTSNPSGTNTQGNSIVVTPTTTTTYTVTLSNAENCLEQPFTSSATITVLDNYFLQQIDPIAVCYGEEVQLSSPGSVGSYVWTYGSETSNDPVFVFTAEESGTVSVYIQNVTCSDQQTIPITVWIPETYEIIGENPICFGDEVTLTLQPANFTNVDWTGNGTFIANAGSIDDTPTLTTLYEASILDNNGCASNAELSVVVNPLPAIELGPDILLCDETSVNLSSPSSPSGSDYYWSTGDQTIFIMVESTGIYSLEVVDNNCSSFDSVSVVFEPPSWLGQIPNVITADGNAVNDYLSYESESLLSFHIVITNRWGETLFESFDPAIFWDGTNKGRKVSEGVYFYVVKYRTLCEDEDTVQHGSISVFN